MSIVRALALCTSAAAIAAVTAAPAGATGVEAGTLITNTASATYTSGASAGSVQSNAVTVRVDELLDVAVAAASGTPVVLGASAQDAVLPFTITNTGNGPEAFTITVTPAVAGNQFDAAVQSLVVDSNANGTYDPGTDAVLASGAATPIIPSDGSLKLFVLARLPAGVGDGKTSQLRLGAAALTGTGAPGTTFAGKGDGGGDAVAGASGAAGDGLAALSASAVTVSLAKSATIRDPFGGATPVPGAIVRYAIVASVTGSGTASGLRITDAFPAGTAYRPGSIALDSTSLTDAADADAGAASAQGIDVQLGDVTGGTSKTVSFEVRIN